MQPERPSRNPRPDSPARICSNKRGLFGVRRFIAAFSLFSQTVAASGLHLKTILESFLTAQKAAINRRTPKDRLFWAAT